MLSKFFTWFLKTKTWVWFASTILSRFDLRFWGYPGFPIEDFFKIVDVGATNGSQVYAFSCIDKQSLAAKLITWVVGNQAKYSHSGIVIFGGDRGTKALHMKGDGAHFEHLLRVLKEVDAFTLVAMPVHVDDRAMAFARIHEILESQEKLAYDYQQQLSSRDKLYCSELVFHVCEGLLKLTPSLVAGRQVFTPDDVVKYGRVLYSNVTEEKPDA